MSGKPTLSATFSPTSAILRASLPDRIRRGQAGGIQPHILNGYISSYISASDVNISYASESDLGTNPHTPSITQYIRVLLLTLLKLPILVNRLDSIYLKGPPQYHSFR